MSVDFLKQIAKSLQEKISDSEYVMTKMEQKHIQIYQIPQNG